MKDEVMNAGEAWRAYRLLRSDDRIRYATEPKSCLKSGRFLQKARKPRHLWTDAYLCAFAHAARATLVTFDAKIPARRNVPLLVLKGIS
jgi:predicted nucleic acid-binding protein